ncbi:MAG: hypothetical protein K6B39_08445 [Lachnospiraceae bacterium]|nr:hypothetical protein [Lachnospiraceae bacterium]
MKSSDEMFANVLARMEQHNRRSGIRRGRIKQAMLAVACLLCAVMLGLLLPRISRGSEGDVRETGIVTEFVTHTPEYEIPTDMPVPPLPPQPSTRLFLSAGNASSARAMQYNHSNGQ